MPFPSQVNDPLRSAKGTDPRCPVAISWIAGRGGGDGRLFPEGQRGRPQVVVASLLSLLPRSVFSCCHATPFVRAPSLITCSLCFQSCIAFVNNSKRKISPPGKHLVHCFLLLHSPSGPEVEPSFYPPRKVIFSSGPAELAAWEVGFPLLCSPSRPPPTKGTIFLNYLCVSQLANLIFPLSMLIIITE